MPWLPYPFSPYLERGMSDPDPDNRTAIIDAEGSWSYGRLAGAVDIAAHHLLAGAASLNGERIGVFLDPRAESLAAFLAILQAGAIALPLSIHATARELAYQVRDAGVERVVATDAFAPLIDEIVALGAPLRVLDRPALFGPPADNNAARGPVPEDGAVILYTSGTTGQPKGVLHTHATLLNQVDVLHDAWGWHESDRLLHVLPLHHVHGLINGALGALRAGGELRLLPRFDATAVWNAFAAGEASVFYAVPTVYHQLVEAWQRQPDAAIRDAWVKGAQSLRLAVSGSAALPATLWHRWLEITGSALLERYGMTEIGMALSNPYEGERRPGTVGQPLPTMEIRIVDEDGRDVSPGEPGEIWVRGGSVFKEYWRRPEATAESFRDGYFLTGDIAQVDDGYVRILGRASADIIKSGGYKLSALEIEEVLLGHPSVGEVAVVGAPDEQWGEIVTACVVLREGKTLTAEDVKAWCADKLSPYKQPRRLEFYAALPRNAMGKVQKPALRDSLASER